MKATRIYALLALLLMVMAGTAKAQVFEAVCETEQTLRYAITSQNPPEVELVACLDHFIGGCTIPATVAHNDIDYSVVSIGEDAFSFGGGAFHFNGSLSIPNTVRSIGADAFLETNFTGPLVIPNSVEHIGIRAFFGCDGFTSLTLSESLVEIGKEAFCICYGFRGDLTIPASVEYIDYDAFYQCRFDGTLTLSPNLVYIECGRFTECYYFTDIVIPEGITGIGGDAFDFLSFPTELTLPSTLQDIEDYAFCHMIHLEQMTIKSYNPPYMDENTFMQTNRDIPIYIPLGTIDDYRNAEYWSEFTNFIEVDFEGVDENGDDPKAEAYPNPGFNLLNIKNSTPNAQVEVYDMAGRLMHCQAIAEGTATIDAMLWPSGVYAWRVFSEKEGKTVGKWVKK